MTEEDCLVGRCCERKSEYLIVFNGKPMRDYAVYLCKIHLNESPFNANILKITSLGET